jgi:carboxyl-terminal processing protease
MMTTIRLTIRLAVLMLVTSFSAFGQSLSSTDDENGGLRVHRSDFRSERFYSDDDSFHGGSIPPQTSMLFGDDELQELLPSWFELLAERSTIATSAQPMIPWSPEITNPPSGRTQRQQSRVPVNTVSMNSSLGRRVLIDGGQLNTRDYREDAVYSEGQFDLPFEKKQAPDDNRESFPAEGPVPFTPPAVLDGQPGDESAAIEEVISMRYQNPITARVIRGMSGSQAVRLFSEVSQMIDERALHPTSYDVRVRRALRNLTVALDHPAFINSLGLSANSSQLKGFRDSLHRLSDSGSIKNHQEAVSLLNHVMAQAPAIEGLTSAAVGFEFTNASIDTLDKFSALEPADPAVQHSAEKEVLAGDGLDEEIVGIGREVREHVEGLVVIKPLRGGPAAEAGIEPGDIIRSIDDQDIRGMKIVNSMDLLRGPGGSSMKLRIDHGGGSEHDLTLTRRIVRVWTVNDAKIVNGTDVGYFSLSRFGRSSTAEVDDALNSLHDNGMKSLILDLRGDPGGLLTTCVEISDRFVPCGTIMSTKGRLDADNMIQMATYARTWSVPMVVLVDGDSASASEIFAAAIQENRRGLIVGMRSYGKGTVQTHFPLSSIRGALRLTTAMFFSPNGRTMSGTGVIPDVEVEDRDGILNGDKVLAEALRIAQSSTVRDMAKVSGTCRPQNPTASKSSSLKDIVDPAHPGTTVL